VIARLAARTGWAVVVVVAAAWLALVEAFWLPLRAGAVPVPLSVLAAVAGNLLLVRLAHRLTGSRAVAVLPGVVWLVIALGATVRRPEGDLVLVGGGVTGAVGLAFLVCGVIAAAFAAGQVLGGGRRAPTSATARASAGRG
jgi:hypothetical protein